MLLLLIGYFGGLSALVLVALEFFGIQCHRFKHAIIVDCPGYDRFLRDAYVIAGHVYHTGEKRIKTGWFINVKEKVIGNVTKCYNTLEYVVWSADPKFDPFNYNLCRVTLSCDSDHPVTRIQRTILNPRPWQQKIIDDMAKISARVIILSGPPNIGKSAFGIVLAQVHKRSNVAVVNRASFRNIVASSECSVMLLDEFDDMLEKIDTDTTAKRVNKSTYSTLMDFTVAKPNILIVMTTNRTPEQLHATFDTAMFRPGRVDAVYHIADDAITKSKLFGHA